MVQNALEAQVKNDRDADLKQFARGALAEYRKYTKNTRDHTLGMAISKAIMWTLVKIDEIVFEDAPGLSLGVESVADQIKGNLNGFVEKIFSGNAKKDALKKTLANLMHKAFKLSGTLYDNSVKQRNAPSEHLDIVDELKFDLGPDTDHDVKFAKWKRMRENMDVVPISVDLVDVYESGRARSEIDTALRSVRALLLALFAGSLMTKSGYRVKRSIRPNEVIAVLPEMEHRKTPVFEFFGITNILNNDAAKKFGKYINEAMTYYYGFYAACIKRGISVKNNTVFVDNLTVADTFFIMHLCYILGTDPIAQLKLTPTEEELSAPYDLSGDDIQYNNLLGVNGHTAEAFVHFCRGPVNAAKLLWRMESQWGTDLGHASIMESGVNSFLSYGRMRKHFSKILRLASRDIFARDRNSRICDSKTYFAGAGTAAQVESAHAEMPIHARYVNFDEATGKIKIPSSVQIGLLGGGSQRYVQEESKEEFTRTLDEGVCVCDVDRISQFFADRLDGVFDLSKRDKKDTTKDEFEESGNIGLRKFSSILAEKLQFVRDDIITGNRYDALCLLDYVNDEQFVGEMLEGLLTSDESDWNYLGDDMTGKMRMFTVLMTGGKFTDYPDEYSTEFMSRVKYEMDVHKVGYMLNSVIAVNSTGKGQALDGIGGLPKNTQIITLRAIEAFSKQMQFDTRYRFDAKETIERRTEKIIEFVNELAVALIRTDIGDNDAKVRFTMMRREDVVTFGSFVVRKILLKWYYRNIYRLMGFVPTDETDVISSDIVSNIIMGSSGDLFLPIIRDLEIRPKLNYLPEESISDVRIGFVDSFDANDMIDADMDTKTRGHLIYAINAIRSNEALGLPVYVSGLGDPTGDIAFYEELP
jgi:hypothetical protein